MPTSPWIVRSSCCICWRSFRSSAPSGSSSSSTLRAVHEGARERHALALAAGELRGAATLVAAQAHQLERLGGPPARAPRLSTFAIRSPYCDVLANAHVGKERVVLEHGVHVALVGRQVGDVAPRQLYPSFVRPLEARDHAQAGGLPRAGRAKQREELVFGDIQVDPVDRHDVPVRLASCRRGARQRPHSGSPRFLYTLERPVCE